MANKCLDQRITAGNTSGYPGIGIVIQIINIIIDGEVPVTEVTGSTIDFNVGQYIKTTIYTWAGPHLHHICFARAASLCQNHSGTTRWVIDVLKGKYHIIATIGRYKNT